jgi:hypothetical protein
VKIGLYFLERCLACISCDVDDEAIQLLFRKLTTAKSFSEYTGSKFEIRWTSGLKKVVVSQKLTCMSETDTLLISDIDV